jgi:hypothetical protein
LPPAEGDLEGDQRGHGGQVRREIALEAGQCAVRLLDPPQEEEPADLEEPGVRGVLEVAVRREGAQGLRQRPRRPDQVPCRQGNLRFGGEAPRPGDALPRPEPASRAA